MKLSEAVKIYEECFGPDNKASGCIYKNCPIGKDIKIITGDPSDEFGEITWKLEGCSIFARLEEWFKNKKPGTPYPVESE